MPDKKSYDVGYGKPPKRTRFKAGQSGNPRGRPKGSDSIETLLAKHLGRKVNVMIDGQKRRASVKEAVVLSLVKSLLSGTPDQKIKLLKFAGPMLAQQEVPQDAFNYGNLTDEELDLLENLLVKGEVPELEPDE